MKSIVNRRHQNSAFTLVEMLLVMSMLSALSVGAVTVLIRVKRSSKAIEARLADTRSLARLSQTWRRDVHVCQQVTTELDGDVFFVAQDAHGGSVRYQIVRSDGRTSEPKDSTVRRELIRDEKVIGRDVFSITKGASIECDSLSVSDHEFVSLTISEPARSDGDPRTVLHVESRLTSLPGRLDPLTDQVPQS